MERKKTGKMKGNRSSLSQQPNIAKSRSPSRGPRTGVAVHPAPPHDHEDLPVTRPAWPSVPFLVSFCSAGWCQKSSHHISSIYPFGGTCLLVQLVGEKPMIESKHVSQNFPNELNAF